MVVLFSITVGQTILNGNARGQTHGKRVLGIRVIDVREGGPIGYGRSLARWGVPTVINLFFGFFSLVDCLWPLWDARNQAVHDGSRTASSCACSSSTFGTVAVGTET